MSLDQQIEQIDKKLLIARIVDLPGTLIFGLAIYARFYAQGDAVISFLNIPTVVDSMFVTGLVLMVWGGFRIFRLKREKARLNNTASS